MRDVYCFRLEREKAILVNEVALVQKERDDQLLMAENEKQEALHVPANEKGTQLRSQGSLLPALRSGRERDPRKRWSRGSGTKIILREESFVSHCFCLAYAVIATAR